ncbi:MAG: rhodanese-like domain-containing protein [Epsilonproteobacteria bacterium]|nr:rhodanese-like domain-containing protein [Campylobacterota bacterium]
MFGFFKKKEPKIELKNDPFPTYDEVQNLTIIDIREPEDVEYYGSFENAINIPYDEYFASKLMMLDKSKEYGVMDLKGVEVILDEAVKTAKDIGLNAKKLKGGFFYITEVINYKPKK